MSNNYVDLINATLTTLGDKKYLTKVMKDKALRFYHIMSELKSTFDDATRTRFADYEKYLHERKVLL